MDENNTAVRNLRAAADLIESLPADLPTPTHVKWEPYLRMPGVEWMFFSGKDDAEQKALASSIVRSIGGHWDKRELGDDLFNFRCITGGVKLEVTVSRSAVCELVVTGVETVTEEVPDPEALAQVPTITVTREIEQTEWHCQPLLAEAVSR